MKERLGDNLGIADCHINLGEAYRAHGDTPQAIHHLEKGLVMARTIGAHQAEAECQRQLAECYLEVNQPEQARRICEEALAHARGINEKKEEGIIQRVLGNVYLQLHDTSMALAHFQKSLVILRELNREYDLGNTLYDYARALLSVQRRAEAQQSLEEAVALFKRLQIPQEKAKAQVALDDLKRAGAS